MSRSILLLAGLWMGCGGGPTAAPGAAPASVAPAAPISASELPNPCTANPCDATIIDPAANPCAGAAGEGGAKDPG